VCEPVGCAWRCRRRHIDTHARTHTHTHSDAGAAALGMALQAGAGVKLDTLEVCVCVCVCVCIDERGLVIPADVRAECDFMCAQVASNGIGPQGMAALARAMKAGACR
jgi:hypothetical protein